MNPRFRRPVQKVQQKPNPKKEGCEVKFRRDKQGKIIGFKATGSCSKEHLKIAQGSVGTDSPVED